MAAPGRPDGCTRWPLWETPATPKGHSDHPQGGGTGHGDNPQQPSAGLHPRDSVWNPGQRGTHWILPHRAVHPGGPPWKPTVLHPMWLQGKGSWTLASSTSPSLVVPPASKDPTRKWCPSQSILNRKKNPSPCGIHTHTHTHSEI